MVRIIQQEPGLANLVTSYLLSRMLRIEEELVDQIFHPSEKRLARILLAASALWKKMRVEVRDAEGEPANSCGDGRYGRGARISFFMNRFRPMGFIPYKEGLPENRGLFTFAPQE